MKAKIYSDLSDDQNEKMAKLLNEAMDNKTPIKHRLLIDLAYKAYQLGREEMKLDLDFVNSLKDMRKKL